MDGSTTMVCRDARGPSIIEGRSGHYGLEGIRERSGQTRLQIWISGVAPGAARRSIQELRVRWRISNPRGDSVCHFSQEGGGAVVSSPLWPALPSEASGRAQIVGGVQFPVSFLLNSSFWGVRGAPTFGTGSVLPVRGALPRREACHQARIHAPGDEA